MLWGSSMEASCAAVDHFPKRSERLGCAQHGNVADVVVDLWCTDAGVYLVLCLVIDSVQVVKPETVAC